ncbi:GNAT family N-acetyltransferase [Streptomyces sp. VRA16 Mangrove soil]|uniref:GNAT family N-acetyltransferase n=1 Tax=Streptomyces sp. VRA16 Mangrove soil TaxID=2817434 RepID=UPI001A9D684E|nr:GNAT family N-acetyltransferase [Streptomyces sp. VRA16 Mangrove soil]MBO1336959.1 GNAT family N-acetyltransferase [Streptomyces sp. VRA16 Mangrove soil]
MDSDVQLFTVAHLRRRPAPVETGGFVLGFDPGTTSPYVNYATPLPGCDPTAADVAALIAAFRERDLVPRLEFAPDAAPAAAAALTAAGFVPEAEHTYLVCTPDTLAVPPSGPAVEAPVTDDDYTELDAALAEAFSGEFASSPQGAARLRRTAESGGAVRLVRAADGSVAGGALCSAPAVGTAELAGVGTRPAHRGRGIAAAVTADLARTLLHERGASSVWLEYGGQDSRRVYERVGFRPTGTRLYTRLEA